MRKTIALHAAAALALAVLFAFAQPGHGPIDNPPLIGLSDVLGTSTDGGGLNITNVSIDAVGWIRLHGSNVSLTGDACGTTNTLAEILAAGYDGGAQPISNIVYVIGTNGTRLSFIEGADRMVFQINAADHTIFRTAFVEGSQAGAFSVKVNNSQPALSFRGHATTGVGWENPETLLLQAGGNEWSITSNGVANLNANIFTNVGTLYAQPPVLVETDADSVTLTAADCASVLRVVHVAGNKNYELPAVQKEYLIGACNTTNANVITFDAAAGDIIIMNDGTQLAAGNAVDTSGAIDDKIMLVGLCETYWMVYNEQNICVDGGAD